jgi:8-hydroxy-5-deazaflavin:NADPH oxidoreductase
MKIAIIGGGRVGSALARAWAAKGYDVLLGTRDAVGDTARHLAVTTEVKALTPAAAAAAGDVIVLALPWKAAESVISTLGELTGKVVIDCMNPIAMGPGGMALERGHITSGGETVQAWLPKAQVVKTLNQVGAEIMVSAHDMPASPVMFMAGDDQDAKQTVVGLLSDIGFEPLDAGGIEKARLLEPFALVWINQALARGQGRDWAFAAIRRPKMET